MSWTTPKTNWIDGDYFNLNPDYERIKGNIEYLTELSQALFSDYDSPSLSTYTIDGYPLVDFFNNIVLATRAILNNAYRPPGTPTMSTYQENGPGFTPDQLNIIEGIHLSLYKILNGINEGIPKLEFTLGGNRFGS